MEPEHGNGQEGERTFFVENDDDNIVIFCGFLLRDDSGQCTVGQFCFWDGLVGEFKIDQRIVTETEIAIFSKKNNLFLALLNS